MLMNDIISCGLLVDSHPDNLDFIHDRIIPIQVIAGSRKISSDLNGLVIKDLVYEVKAKTFFSRSRT